MPRAAPAVQTWGSNVFFETTTFSFRACVQHAGMTTRRSIVGFVGGIVGGCFNRTLTAVSREGNAVAVTDVPSAENPSLSVVPSHFGT